jgi:hypothetical protein
MTDYRKIWNLCTKDSEGNPIAHFYGFDTYDDAENTRCCMMDRDRWRVDYVILPTSRDAVFSETKPSPTKITEQSLAKRMSITLTERYHRPDPPTIEICLQAMIDEEVDRIAAHLASHYPDENPTEIAELIRHVTNPPPPEPEPEIVPSGWRVLHEAAGYTLAAQWGRDPGGSQVDFPRQFALDPYAVTVHVNNVPYDRMRMSQVFRRWIKLPGTPDDVVAWSVIGYVIAPPSP